MNVGGVEKSFLGLLSTLSPEEYEIHLGLLRLQGGLLDQVPDHVRIHEISAYKDCWPIINDPPRQSIYREFKAGHLGFALILLSLYVWMKLTKGNYCLYRYLLRKEPVFQESFEIAVAYAGPSQMIDYYLCEKVRAEKKYAWIHFDVTRFGIDRGMTRRLYKQYERIFVVSQEARDKFVALFPQFAGKTEVFKNVVLPSEILRLADSGPSFDDGFRGKRILTVGRISKEKGQREAIEAMKIILASGTDAKWYFVGEGKDMEYCRVLADRLFLTEKVSFLGLQKNPYGFMRDCDIYVQPSRHEGFCITLAEALCFNKPIVTTAFAGAREQLENASNSRIVGFSPEEIAKGIQEFL